MNANTKNTSCFLSKGLLQSDDKIALREITLQLQLENTVGDKVFVSDSCGQTYRRDGFYLCVL